MIMHSRGKIVLIQNEPSHCPLYPASRNVELGPLIYFLLLATDVTEQEEYICERALIRFLGKSGICLTQIT